jgi:hypothetical protein
LQFGFLGFGLEEAVDGSDRCLALGSLIRASFFTLLGSRVAELGIRESWPAFLILAVFFLPLPHPGVRGNVTSKFRRSADPPA